MTKTLTEIITNVQALLLDDGTRFSTATVTAAVRSALKEFNQRAPVYAGTLVDVVSGQKEYVLNSTDFDNLIEVFAVLKQGTDEHLENNIELEHDAYFEDGVPVIRLRQSETSGYLIVRYTIPNTVSGLDSATESTLPAFYDNTLIDGACYWACVVRSTGRVEPINLNDGVTKNLIESMKFYRKAFDYGLAQAAKRRLPVSEPSVTAWNDEYHTWGK